MEEKLYKDKDWLYQKYIVEELSFHKVGELCGVCGCSIKYWLSKYSIPRRSISEQSRISQIKVDYKKRQEKTKQTCLKKYGVDNPTKNKEIANKVKQSHLSKTEQQKQRIIEKRQTTCLEKYGVDHNHKDKKVREKYKQTMVDKYGAENPSQVKELREKADISRKETMIDRYGVDCYPKTKGYLQKRKDTCLERYGVDNPIKDKQVIEKRKESCLKKYGVDHPSKIEEIKNKISKTNKSKEVIDKKQQTCLRTYGVSHFCQTEIFVNKVKQTWENKSQEEIENIQQKYNHKDLQQKRHETMKRNGSYGKSKPEDRYFEYLVNNIDSLTERQVRHKGFSIDFYLPSWDIFVQFDGDYWHGFINTKEELEKSEQGKMILETMRRDIIQNQTISNLVRIRESEFK